ncbi:hypothetical protein PF001_g32532, partial [Phytophthora fragariae]
MALCWFGVSASHQSMSSSSSLCWVWTETGGRAGCCRPLVCCPPPSPSAPPWSRPPRPSPPFPLDPPLPLFPPALLSPSSSLESSSWLPAAVIVTPLLTTTSSSSPSPPPPALSRTRVRGWRCLFGAGGAPALRVVEPAVGVLERRAARVARAVIFALQFL